MNDQKDSSSLWSFVEVLDYRTYSMTPQQSSCSGSLCTEGPCAVDGERQKKNHTYCTCPKLTHSRGWCLLARFGVCLCGLARALVLSIHSHLRSRSCARLWEALILSCNERSQQENKALFFQSSGSDVSTAPIQPLLTSRLS